MPANRPLWLAFLLTAAPLAAAPVIHCDAPVFDFGDQPIEQPVDHVFTIENRGDQELIVSEVRPGCSSCTTAGLQPDRLPPGGKATLKVHLTLGAFRGPIRKSVMLKSNDPAKPAYEVSLRGTVITEVMMTPDLLSFAQVPVGGVVSGRVEIACTSTNRMVITKLAPDTPELTATFSTIEEGRRYELQVSMKGVAPKPDPTKSGAFNAQQEGHVVIFIDHPTQEAVVLTVKGFIRDKLYIVPNLVPLVPNALPGTTRQLMMQFDDQPDFKVTAVEWPEGSVEFDWAQLGQGRGRLTLRNFTASPSLNGREVIIRTNMPGKEEVRVPIRILGEAANRPGAVIERIPQPKP